jgi:hypothetical protein
MRQLLTEFRDRAPKARLEALPMSGATGLLLESGEADLALETGQTAFHRWC